MDINELDKEIMENYTDYLVDKIENKDPKIAILLIKIDKFVDELLKENNPNDVYDALTIYASGVVIKIIEQVKNDILKHNRCLYRPYY